ncbi:hypothetical protein V1511DRAFT_259820 [Dipodascopsis uninucleata]
MSSMTNFTGNYRHGRNINLARGSGSTARSSQSILKDASAARLLREQTRKRERAAIKIQNFYRGRRDVELARKQMKARFLKEGTHQAPSKAVAMFIFAWGHSKIENEDMIPVLRESLEANGGFFQVDATLSKKLAGVLIGYINTGICGNNLKSADIRSSCLQLLRSCQIKIPLEYAVRAYSTLLRDLNDSNIINLLVDNLIMRLETESDRDYALKVFIEDLLSTPDMFLKLDNICRRRIINLYPWSSIISVLSNTPIIIFYNESDQDERAISLLANILYIWKWLFSESNRSMPVDFLRSISNVIRSISVSTSKKLARTMSSASATSNIASQFMIENISVLKERSVIELAFKPLMVSDKLDANDALTICAYFVSLVRIWPSQNSQIRYFLYLTPEYSLPLFFHALQSSRIYDVILRMDVSATTTSGASLWRPAATNDNYNKDVQEWEILGLFLDICWHWMIMTDDDEFFDESQYGLSISDVKELGIFLRNLSFLIICNEDPTTSSYRGRLLKIGNGGDNDIALSKSSGLTLNKIKSDAVGIMRQIFYRNTRRKFLSRDFWRLDDQIDIPAFTSQAVLDEDKMDQYFDQAMKDDSEDDSTVDEMDDESSGVSSTKSRRLLRNQMMLTPRIEILQRIPFILPFEARVEIFERSLDQDRQKIGLDRDYELRWRRHKAEIRRSHILEDAFNQLNSLRGELKSLIGITFVSDYGVEAGIDGGGITKEFLIGVCKEGFDPAFGLFLENDQNLLYPNPAATSSVQLQYFEFLGRIVGKALYQGILLEVSFANFFLSKWQVPNNTIFGGGFRNTFDDLWSLDPELYRGLIDLKKYKGDVETDFALNFTITDTQGRTVELVKNGAQIPVTSTNRLQYIHEVASFKLNKELYRQTSAFLSGMNDLLSPTWLVMFSPDEMQTLVGGAPIPIDLEDWKKHTVYGGFTEKDATIQYFWEVMEELSDSDVRAVLKFVTSVSRAPLQGFGSLKPYFTIRESGLMQDRLPTSSTCVNLLKLPRYESKELLKSKLMYSVLSGAGFDLS